MYWNTVLRNVSLAALAKALDTPCACTWMAISIVYGLPRYKERLRRAVRIPPCIINRASAGPAGNCPSLTRNSTEKCQPRQPAQRKLQATHSIHTHMAYRTGREGGPGPGVYRIPLWLYGDTVHTGPGMVYIEGGAPMNSSSDSEFENSASSSSAATAAVTTL